MFRLAVPSFLLSCGSAMAVTQAYCPLKQGNEWEFRGPKEMSMTIRVTGTAKVNGVLCMVVVTRTGGQVTKEYLATADDGIRCHRSEAGGQTVQPDPPLLRLKLPYRKGDTWRAQFTQQGATYVTQYRATGPDIVRVPAGRFKCVTVTSTMRGPAGQMLSTTWYCPGIGPVRQNVSMGQMNLNFELVRTNVEAGADKTGASVGPTKRYCPKCKADRPSSFKFCPGCGTATIRKAVTPAKRVCPKCGSRSERTAKLCSRCGSRLTGSAAKVSGKRPPKPTPTSVPKRYESPDGKVLLYHPEGWKVQQGAMFGRGSYSVMVQNPDQTAAVMFMTLPLGQQVKDSVAMARIHLASMSRANRVVDVTRMTSAKDRARTRAVVNTTTADGQDMKAHVHYFYTPRVGTMFCLMARQDKWKASLPTLAQVVANLAYSPEGVRTIQKKARESAAADRRVSSAGRRPLSPMALLAAAEHRQGRQLPLAQVTAPDQSFTIQIPQGWQFQGAVLQYWTSPDWQRKTHGVSFVSKEMLSPRATSIRMPGVIMSDYVPPPQALALVIADSQVGRNVQILAETPAAQIVPDVAQYLRMRRAAAFGATSG